MSKINYKGLFIDNEDAGFLHYIEGTRSLPRGIPDMHITFSYRDESLFPKEFMGKSMPVKIVGYGNDGVNSGFKVELPEELEGLYAGAENKHITTSLSPRARAKDTKSLKFRPIAPITIHGKLGYHLADTEQGTIVYNNDLQ